jgi:hypothetical protein
MSSDRTLRPSHYSAFLVSVTDPRLICAACGVVALCALGFMGEGPLADRVAQLGLVALSLATAIGWVQLARSRQATGPPCQRAQTRRSNTWLLVTIAVGLISLVVVQSWFQPGTIIATGDIPPPVDAGWLGRLFQPWAWTGSNLGEPSQLPAMLPWAAVVSIVHTVGGHPDLAQRIWYTALYVGATLSALAFMAALRMSPTAAVVGTAVYVLNPYVVSVVNIYPNYIAALALLAALPAVVLAVGSGRLTIRWGAVLIAASAPMLGFTFSNPPLVGMIIVAMLVTPLLVAWIEGKEAALRSVRSLLLGLPLLVAASAYWIVPVFLQLSGVSGNQLANLAAWTWTEGRANVRNAFWLNPFWAWSFPQYFPYATAYESFPLSFARFALPATAFGALALRQLVPGHVEHKLHDRRLRLAVAAASAALLVVFLSTGTNPPGNLIFDRLYGLPLGWLIREPGRFLMVAALAYAVLVAVVIEALTSNRGVLDLLRSRPLSRRAISMLYIPVALGVPLLVGFPLYTGKVVVDERPLLPPSHVRMPTDWAAMARFVDGLPVQGSLLMMPPDDFYAMPYSWGYYGSDGFVVDTFQRPVLVPNPQGYTPTSSEVIGAVDLMGQSILEGNWSQVEVLATALHTPLILVRLDIQSPYQGRPILSPREIANSLSIAPNFVLVRQIGSLDLFALTSTLRDPETATGFATINSQQPDLRILSLLPPGTALVSSQPLLGAPRVDKVPPVEQWQITAGGLEWESASLPRSDYRIADLGTRTVVSRDGAGTFNVDHTAVRIVNAIGGTSETVTASVPGRTAISNGDFSGGPWAPVGDCPGVPSTQSNVGAKVIPNAAPGGSSALQLTASFGSVCVNRSLTWHGGSLVVNLMVDRVEGTPPRICLWEFGANRCASLPAMPTAIGWSEYRASVTPDPGTTGLGVSLFADGPAQGGHTVAEYASVRVIELSTLPDLVLLSTPVGQPGGGPRLAVLHNSYSDAWVSNEGRHVLVDGMLNGWLIGPGSKQFRTWYGPGGAFMGAQWVSLSTLIVVIVAFTAVWTHRLIERNIRLTTQARIRGQLWWRRFAGKAK